MSLSQPSSDWQKFLASKTAAIALGFIGLGVIALSRYGWRHSVLFVLGALLGLTLHHARFGFSSAYRNWWLHRDGRGLLAQCLLLAVATVLFAPVLAAGEIAGETIRGALAPVGVMGMVGAFVFGIGMQWGGGCGCGSLAGLGRGNGSIVITILTFCLGSFLASLTRPLWAQLPSWQPIVWNQSLGWVGGVVLQLALLGVLAGIIAWLDQAPVTSLSESNLGSDQPSKQRWSQIIRGPWSLTTGAFVLAVLAWLTLIFSGQPWRITWGFLIWGAHLAQSLGWTPGQAPFWQSEPAQFALNHSIFADVSSMMNLSLILGAVLGAGLAGNFTIRFDLTTPQLLARGLGGLLMGYGALLSFGCNISAFLGGIASLSLHGWLWIIFALLGSWLGIQMRPFFKFKDGN